MTYRQLIKNLIESVANLDDDAKVNIIYRKEQIIGKIALHLYSFLL